MAGYNYYKSTGAAHTTSRRTQASLRLSRNRAEPRLTDPDYLILRGRANILEVCLNEIAEEHLHVLDVGGRLQPYRKMLQSRTESYIAIDPQLEGLADVVATAEHLPFADEQFDLIICAQVLSYVEDPAAAIGEMHRVLKNGGYLFVSVPTNCPQYFDERWRFLRDGIEVLLHDFSDVHIYPETYSLGGVLRTINKILEQSHSRTGRRIARRILFPVLNTLGRRLDSRVFKNEFLTPNYSAFARKA